LEQYIPPDITELLMKSMRLADDTDELTSAELPSISSIWDRYAADERWVRDQLARFTYKPGWSFTVANDLIPSSSGVLIALVARVEDTYNPGKHIEIGGYRRAQIYIRDPDMFAKQLASFIVELEIHESREWLKRDGQIYDDPHKNP